MLHRKPNINPLIINDFVTIIRYFMSIQIDIKNVNVAITKMTELLNPIKSNKPVMPKIINSKPHISLPLSSTSFSELVVFSPKKLGFINRQINAETYINLNEEIIHCSAKRDITLAAKNINAIIQITTNTIFNFLFISIEIHVLKLLRKT